LAIVVFVTGEALMAWVVRAPLVWLPNLDGLKLVRFLASLLRGISPAKGGIRLVG